LDNIKPGFFLVPQVFDFAKNSQLWQPTALAGLTLTCDCHNWATHWMPAGIAGG